MGASTITVLPTRISLIAERKVFKAVFRCFMLDYKKTNQTMIQYQNFL
jgi:hypothetical protein